MTPGKVGKYRGRREYDPGKMHWRHKGSFRSEGAARAFQKSLKALGYKTKIEHYPQSEYPWGLYVMAKHDFWKRDFLVG